MAFLLDQQELKTGLIIFRRADVAHRNWYCRVRMPKADRYKTVSLKTSDINRAKELAFEQDADLRFRIKHAVPVFNRPFSQIAKDFADFQKQRADAGEITFHRWRVIDSHIRTQLNRYVGTIQINLINVDKWKSYPMWRQANGKGRSGGRVSTGTIRDEMNTYRSIMAYAASKKYIAESQVPKGKLPVEKVAREEFTPQEYRKLHSFARSWIEQSRTDDIRWSRTMAYNFILIMTNTGMRPSEARNLLWRDVSLRQDKQGRRFVVLNVRGKGKHRNLVAAANVAEYLDRVRELSKPNDDNQHVFVTNAGWSSYDKNDKAQGNKEALEKGVRSKHTKGVSARTLYYGVIERLLLESNLMLSSTGRRRSTYCFRHTYATFRLSEGVDVYFLSKQMGTSVKMIEDHYGHITPTKNADRILLGLPGWESIAAAPQETR
jgi:integrase